jgi:hypothetical protein
MLSELVGITVQTWKPEISGSESEHCLVFRSCKEQKKPCHQRSNPKEDAEVPLSKHPVRSDTRLRHPKPAQQTNW